MDIQCTIGMTTNSGDCHSTAYSKCKTVYNLKTFTQADIELLRFRVDNFSPAGDDTICHYHKCKYLDYYSAQYGRYCCDPFKKHKKFIKENLRALDLETCQDYLSAAFIKLIPGQQICVNCQKAITIEVEKYHETKKEASPTHVESVKFNLCDVNPQQGQTLPQSQTSESSTSSLQHQISDSSHY